MRLQMREFERLENFQRELEGSVLIIADAGRAFY